MILTVCVECSLRALLARESAPIFEESSEAHHARVHPDPDRSDYEYRQLIAAVWTLDDARWQEVERGLREQGERWDVTHEAARSLGVLRDFALLRPMNGDVSAQEAVRDLILDAYSANEAQTD